MLLYLVLGQSGIGYRAALQKAGHPQLLESFEELTGSTGLWFKDAGHYEDLRDPMLTPSDFRFFLDSGAYAAWSRGAVVDLDEYIEFIRANVDQIDVVASLDVIPGVPGRPRTPWETDSAADQSWANYLRMRAEGVEALPVYHYGESRKHLDRMLDYGCDYIGVGGLVGTGTDARVEFLDELFEYLCDADGKPRVKTHGFGVTTISLIFDYPWHSVDSTTWVRNSMNGKIILPAYRHGEFVFDRMPGAYVIVTDRAAGRTDGISGDTCGAEVRGVIDRWLAFCGTDYESCRNSYFHRSIANVCFFREVARSRLDVRFVRKVSKQQRFL